MNHMQAQQTPNGPPAPPPPPEPHYRFRWSIVAVVLAVLAFFWLRDGLVPSFQFQDVLNHLRTKHEDRYVRLACLAVVLIVVTLIAKIIRRGSK